MQMIAVGDFLSRDTYRHTYTYPPPPPPQKKRERGGHRCLVGITCCSDGFTLGHMMVTECSLVDRDVHYTCTMYTGLYHHVYWYTSTLYMLGSTCSKLLPNMAIQVCEYAITSWPTLQAYEWQQCHALHILLSVDIGTIILWQ